MNEWMKDKVGNHWLTVILFWFNVCFSSGHWWSKTALTQKQRWAHCSFHVSALCNVILLEFPVKSWNMLSFECQSFPLTVQSKTELQGSHRITAAALQAVMTDEICAQFELSEMLIWHYGITVCDILCSIWFCFMLFPETSWKSAQTTVPVIAPWGSTEFMLGESSLLADFSPNSSGFSFS